MKKIGLALLAICLMACEEESSPFVAVDWMSSESSHGYSYLIESSSSVIIVPVNSSASYRRSSSSKPPNWSDMFDSTERRICKTAIMDASERTHFDFCTAIDGERITYVPCTDNIHNADSVKAYVKFCDEATRIISDAGFQEDKVSECLLIYNTWCGFIRDYL